MGDWNCNIMELLLMKKLYRRQFGLSWGGGSLLDAAFIHLDGWFLISFASKSPWQRWHGNGPPCKHINRYMGAPSRQSMLLGLKKMFLIFMEFFGHPPHYFPNLMPSNTINSLKYLSKKHQSQSISQKGFKTTQMN